MDKRVELYKAAFSQSGRGCAIPKFYGSNRYQYGQGFGVVLRGIFRFFRPVVVKGAQTLFKEGGEALNQKTTVKEALKSSIKPALGALLSAIADQVAAKFLNDKMAAALYSGPPTDHPEVVLVGPEGQRGSGARKH
jgi:hypothetical protein